MAKPRSHVFMSSLSFSRSLRVLSKHQGQLIPILSIKRWLEGYSSQKTTNEAQRSLSEKKRCRNFSEFHIWGFCAINMKMVSELGVPRAS